MFVTKSILNNIKRDKMNIYCKSALHQISFAVMTIVEMIEKLAEHDFQKRPSVGKHSLGELLEHIAIICEADLLISDRATQVEMNKFYSSLSHKKPNEMKDTLLKNYLSLEDKYLNYTEVDLRERIISYWGVTYSRYEWLLEILAQVYHHRGQLHTMLVHCYVIDSNNDALYNCIFL
ncbi:DinB family protein [Solibacillus cecembensis]|uniref:DinB family protein n=1 Tax=Solibacillus cecembensis TaxID=459347 RepID=UPI003CFDDD93